MTHIRTQSDQKANARPRIHHVTEPGVPWAAQWAHRDAIEVVSAAGRLDTIVLPKVTSAEHVAWLDLLLGQVEREAGLPPGQTGIEARGAVMLDDEMIDEASHKMARAIVAKGRAAGLTAP